MNIKDLENLTGNFPEERKIIVKMGLHYYEVKFVMLDVNFICYGDRKGGYLSAENGEKAVLIKVINES